LEVAERVALLAPVNPFNARYVQTKQERAGHFAQALPAHAALAAIAAQAAVDDPGRVPAAG